MTDNRGKGSFPPWSRIQGLDEMCAEAGVDFDSFINDMKANVGIREMAAKHKVSLDTMSLLQEHFIKYGLSSVMGGD
ncbi:helix-turn-helix domain-containing protein [Syntrophomonas curvata]